MTTPKIIPNGLPTIYEEATGRDQFEDPAGRRYGGLFIVQDEKGRVLMCEKSPIREMRKPWYHPGGAAEENEDVQAAAVRMARAKLGIDLEVGRLLVVHQMFAEEHVSTDGRRYVSREGMNWVFSGGTIPSDTKFTYGAGVLGHRWFEPRELKEYLSPFTAQRTLAALEALETGEVVWLKGHPQE